MSECVVRMDMPRNCHECPVGHQSFGDTPCWCKLAFEKNEAVSDGLMWREVDPQTRPDWCPILCQLPEGHGDLIGREYAIAIACSGLIRTLQTTEGGENWIRVNEVRDSIKSAPTIVPAERSET